ncbi:afadin-like protein [Lasius niger]|uniref:Afadin-like protein n=3 Tax=Lasius TaxID=488720 RepID=A0A0J7MPD9_LASNI|nr:afadin-like protein [Lasius niger]
MNSKDKMIPRALQTSSGTCLIYTVMLANVATMIQRVIQAFWPFWLANGSELLHMLKSDRHVGGFPTRAQDILANAVHTAFGSLVRCVTLEPERNLRAAIPLQQTHVLMRSLRKWT